MTQTEGGKPVSEMPERIWAWETEDGTLQDWSCVKASNPKCAAIETEYTRADLHAAEVTKLTVKNAIQKDAIDELSSQLNDYIERTRVAEQQIRAIQEIHAQVMSEKCPSDERHCTCVPVLRAELARVKRESVRYSWLADWINRSRDRYNRKRFHNNDQGWIAYYVLEDMREMIWRIQSTLSRTTKPQEGKG